MSPILGAIIIAAHNEEASIGRCLAALREASSAGIQVIVVCNGCTDATADIAHDYQGVTVIELAVASKVAALRAGDRVAGDGPRIYLDADIVLTSRAAVAVLEILSGGPVLAGRPPVRYDYDRASGAVRRWYNIRERLPSIQNALWGAGCYALSSEGRSRFGEFPDVVSDDLFIDSLFSDAEIMIVPTDPVVVRTPRKTADLVRILRRKYRTQGEFAAKRPGTLVTPGQRGQLHDLVAVVKSRPTLAFDAAVYASLIAYSRVRARFVKTSGWERDNSSREMA